MLNLSLEEMKVTKTIFIVAYKALQPMMLRTEGIYDTIHKTGWRNRGSLDYHAKDD